MVVYVKLVLLKISKFDGHLQSNILLVPTVLTGDKFLSLRSCYEVC